MTVSTHCRQPLTRSSLYRCLQRHGISRLPEIVGDKPAKQPFKRYPIGCFHIDIAEVRTEEGKLYLFAAMDRTIKYAFAQLVRKATGAAARSFLDELAAAFPYQIHTVLTDNGIRSPTYPRTVMASPPGGAVIPSTGPARNGIEHRPTKPNHPGPTARLEDEPHTQGSHRPAIPLRDPPEARRSPRRVP